MLRNLHLLIVSLLLSAVYSFGQTGLGEIKGVVIDKKTKAPLEGSKVLIYQNGTIKVGANTDEDGGFQITSLSPGAYDVEVKNVGEGYQSIRLDGVVVQSDRTTFLNSEELALEKPEGDKPKDATSLDAVEIKYYRIPLITKDGGPSGQTIGRDDIKNMATRDASGIAQMVGGVNTNEGTGGMSIRGSREDASYYYIDGVKVRGSANLPKSALEEVSVITGGLPANYGDVTGGIVSITTRGPSSTFFGSLEGVTSGMHIKGKNPLGYDGKSFGLDPYAYNLVEGMLSGPLLMKKDSTGAKVKPILGFLVSASYLNELDGRPLNGGSLRVKEDVRDAIVANPLVVRGDGQGTYYATQFLKESDFENVKYRMNAGRQVVSAQAKIDVNTGPSVTLSFGGSMNYSDNSLYNRNGSLFNWNNFGTSKSLDWRVFGRFTQRFKNEREGSASKFRSAFYTLMVDYSQSSTQQYDERFKYNIFNYGHVGKFESNYSTSYVLGQDNSGNAIVYNEAVPYQDGVTFTPSELNPDLARFTSQVYEIRNNRIQDYDQILNANGLLNGYSPTSVYNLWSSFGTPYNGFGKFNNQQFRITGSGSVILKNHTLTLGFEYEQRTDRGWSSGDNGPIGIWNLARLYANSHISEIDREGTPLSVVQMNAYQLITYDRLNTGYAASNGGIYGGARLGDNQRFFDYNVRKELGLNPGGNDFIQIDAMDPNAFRLDMFSADELLNSGNSYINYYGYDHSGNKIKGKTDIDRYFTEFDENGNYKRTIGAFQPTYISGYIMDKFSIKDLVFNVGVRVDVFDANQPVLKDKYLLYNAYTAGEARGQIGQSGKEWLSDQYIPTSMGDDYTVYVDNADAPTAIRGFRNGDTWYNANGDVTENPAGTVGGADGVKPYLVDPSQEQVNASAFEDYKAQVNVMPRISFSFPVSDKSVFFAHYDVLTKRPTSNLRFDPFEYQYLQVRGTNPVNNSNLRPETTVDYALGFQQVIGSNSSIKIEAFYRELRNNVQMISVTEAYPATYRTFGNRDFGTVKGLTLSYDLRRIGNIRMTAAYTLQFADGTGSNTTSQAGLIAAGLPNLRSIFPFSYDQRHALNIMFDYRYGTGTNYNGPKIGNFEVFGNMGLNIQANIYSGNPYSRSTQIINTQTISGGSGQGLDGSTNGSNLPWQYRLDMQLDRTFNFAIKDKKNENKKKALYMNVYIRASNLFNQKNVIGLYRATGNWNDDGYLEAANNQASIQNQVDEQSYRDYYLMKVNNPYNISIPRQIRLGIKFDF